MRTLRLTLGFVLALVFGELAHSQSPPFIVMQTQCGGGGTFTLNPQDKDPNAVLAAGNLGISQNASVLGNNVIARAVASFGSRKFYEEFTPTAGTIGHHGLGWSNASQPLNNDFLGDSANSFEYASNGFAFYNGGTSTLLITASSGLNTPVGVAFDIGNLLLWVTVDGVNWNTALTQPQNPRTGQGGFSLSGLVAAGPYFPAAGVGGDTVQDSENVNFGDRAFAYTVPSGFVSPFSTVSNACAPAPVSGTTRNFLVGVKTGGNGGGANPPTYQTSVSDGLEIDAWIGAIGDNFFVGAANTDTAFSNQPAPTSLRIARAFSLTPSTAFDPTDSSGQCDNAKLTQVANGNFDTQINAALSQMSTDHANGYRTVVLRVGWEAGGSAGFCWSSQATDGPHYVAAFRHVCGLIHANAPFAKIEWNNNLQSDNSGAGGAERSWRAYYPGDDCVDLVSTDLYFSTNGQGGAFLNASTNFSNVLDGGSWGSQPGRNGITGPAGISFMDDFAASTFCTNCPAGTSGGSKLMSFGELGVGGAGANGSYSPASFITQLAAWIVARNSRFAYLAWWNGDDSGSTAIDHDAAAITAWKNAFNGLTFNGTWPQ